MAQPSQRTYGAPIRNGPKRDRHLLNRAGSMEGMPRTRDRRLDLLKGLLIAGVVLGHYLETSGGQKVVMNATGVEITNGQGASIKLTGPQVSINGGALEVI